MTVNENQKLLNEFRLLTEKRDCVSRKITNIIPQLIVRITERISLRQLSRKLERSPAFVSMLKNRFTEAPPKSLDWWFSRLLEINEEVWP
jgi:ribosomal protein S19E (S16A)